MDDNINLSLKNTVSSTINITTFSIAPELNEFFEITFPDVNVIDIYTKTSLHLKDLYEIYNFIITEKQFWSFLNNKSYSNNTYEFESILKNIRKIEDEFNNIISKQDEIKLSKNMTSYFSNLVNLLNKSYTIIHSKSKGAALIKKAFEEHLFIADALFGYLYLNHFPNNMNINTFKGVIYGFLAKDNSNFINENIASEKELLQNLYNNFSNKLKDNEKVYDKMIIDNINQFANLKNELENDSKKTIENMQKLLEEKTENFNSLEKSYSEKLRLSAPAQYWEKLAKTYFKKGWLWILIASILSYSLIKFAYSVLMEVSPKIFPDNAKFDANSIRGTVLLILITSIWVYLISLFVKLSMSSFHLSRDAKERFNLMHVYLSLIKDNALLTEERGIIFQSLFSRADTGLLKGDSSPTMPDMALSQLFKGISGKE